MPSNALLAITLLANLLLAMCMLSDVYGNASRALLAGLVDNLFLLLVLWLLLLWKNMKSRFVQTATALFGTSLLLGLILVPLRTLIGPQTAEPTSAAVLAGLASLLVLIWFLVIMGHILRHAVEVSLGKGIVMAVIVFVVSNRLMEMLVPVQ